MAKVTIKNTARGLRGVNTDGGLVYIEPGATETLEVSGANLKGARGRSYFEFGDSATADSDDEGSEPTGDGLDDMSVGDLDKIIAAENVTVPETGSGQNGNVVKVDKVAAIRAAREGKANGTDALDGMSDDDLRATVQALTGTEPPADADRAALLDLARGATSGS